MNAVVAIQPGEGPSKGLLRDYEPLSGPWFQALLEDLAGDTQEAEEVMRRTLASMQRTQSLVESIRSTTDFSEDAPSRTETEHSSDDAVR